MKLLTKENRNRLPALYSQEGAGDNAIVYLKFFTPDAQWTWYALEGSAIVDMPDKDEYEMVALSELDEIGGHLVWNGKPIIDVRFFGLVDGLVAEYGSFMLSELKTNKGPWGMHIERDMYFDSQPIGKIKEKLNAPY